MKLVAARQGNRVHQFTAELVREQLLVGVRFHLIEEQRDTPFASVCCSSEHEAFSHLQQLPDHEIQSMALAVLCKSENMSQAFEFRQAAAPAYLVFPLERTSVA